MDDAALFALIATERRRAADFFAGLTGEQLATPSLCGAWTVQQVLAHLTAPFSVTALGAIGGIIRHRGFDGFNAALAQRLGERGRDDLVRTLRDNAEHRFTPPGNGAEAPLSDLALHTRDAARPLGLDFQVGPEAWRPVLDFLVSPRSRRAFVPRGRVDGLHLQAPDVGWSSGVGDEVTGPAEALALVLAGRGSALVDLSGDGVPVLRARLA